MLSSLSTTRAVIITNRNSSSILSNYYTDNTSGYSLPTPSIYIPFRDNSFGNFVSGYSNTTDISQFNNPTFGTGIVSSNPQAMSLTRASSQYLKLPNINMSTLTKFSVSIWVNLSASPQGYSNIWNISNYQKPVTADSTNKYTWAIWYNSGGNFRFEYARDGSLGQIRRGKWSNTGVVPGTWYHLVGIQRSSGTDNNNLDFYVNNVKVTNSLSEPTTSVTYNWTSTVHQIGRSSYDNDPYLGGLIDDFRFYPNIELTEQDITNLYNGRNAPNDFIN